MKAKRRALLRPIVLLLCGALSMAIAGEVCPILTIGFWRVAFAQEVAIGYVGPGGGPADHSLISQRFAASPTARFTYRWLYKIGNVHGKAYAVMGLRSVDWEDYLRLRDDLALRGERIFVHCGCIVTDETTESAMLFVEEIHAAPASREAAVKKLHDHFNELKEKKKNS